MEKLKKQVNITFALETGKKLVSFYLTEEQKGLLKAEAVRKNFTVGMLSKSLLWSFICGKSGTEWTDVALYRELIRAATESERPISDYVRHVVLKKISTEKK